jgi:hypothetical protein
MVSGVGKSFNKPFDIQLENNKTLTLTGELSGSFNQLFFYRFKVTRRSNFSATLDELRKNANLTLYTPGLRRIARSKRGGVNPDLIRIQLDPGTYYLRVNRIAGDTKFRLRLLENVDAGNSFKGALRVRVNENRPQQTLNLSDTIGDKGDDLDYYRFEITEPTRFRAVLDQFSSNVDIRLFNSRRRRIGLSTNGGEQSESIRQQLQAGIYFIQINLAPGVTQDTTYNLTLSFTSSTLSAANNSTATALPVVFTSTGSNSSQDAVGGGDNQDFYRVDLTSPSNLNVNLGGLSANADLQLLDSTGTVLGSSTNSGTDPDLVNLSLPVGTYFVRVFPGTRNAVTNYTLDLTANPLRLFGLSDANSLIAFNQDQLDKAIALPVTGLATGETLRSIDFRPATGQLFGLSSSDRLYTVDSATGTATPVGSGPLNPAVTAPVFDVDFNPVVDRLRVDSSTGENLRLVPDTGTVIDSNPSTAGIQTDGPLAFASGDPNFGVSPQVSAIAYTNNFAGTPTTTLFGIDPKLGVLVRQGSADGSPVSPNTGSLFTVGSLGTTLGTNPGFDIFTDTALTNTAYVSSGSTLYTLNLTTGAAIALGNISLSSSTTPVNLISLAIRP